MVFAGLLILIGLSGPVAAVGWRQGRWLSSAHWIHEQISAPAVVATPITGLMVASFGLMVLWPPAVILAFACGVGALWVMARSARTGAARRLPPALRPARCPPPAPRTAPEVVAASPDPADEPRRPQRERRAG